MTTDHENRTMSYYNFRCFDDVIAEVDAFVTQYPDKYSNRSHFIRASIIHLLEKIKEEERVRTIAWNRKRIETR